MNLLVVGALQDIGTRKQEFVLPRLQTRMKAFYISAGATPELASAMRLLGARNAGAAPPVADVGIPSAVEILPQAPLQTLAPAPLQAVLAAAAALPAGPLAAGASAAGPQGSAAVGWRVSLPFAGDCPASFCFNECSDN